MVGPLRCDGTFTSCDFQKVLSLTMVMRSSKFSNNNCLKKFEILINHCNHIHIRRHMVYFALKIRDVLIIGTCYSCMLTHTWTQLSTGTRWCKKTQTGWRMGPSIHIRRRMLGTSVTYHNMSWCFFQSTGFHNRLEKVHRTSVHETVLIR